MTLYEYASLSSDKDFDLVEEEDIAMLTIMHKNKSPKHGGSLFGREYLRRERVKAIDE